MKLLIPTASALILLASLGAASATTYTVLPDGSGDYPTIQAAINASADGDVVELGNGTFQGPGNRDIQYFDKLITVRSQSGDPGACIVDCQGSAAESHRGFDLVGALTSQAVLEGVTITHAYGEYWACAVYCASAATVRNCVLRDNRSGDYGGAGATCHGSSCNATFTQCWFTENFATAGGSAVWVGENGATPRFQSCYFVNNAGYACMASGSSAEFIDCAFSGGTLGGWGAFELWSGSITLSNCTITDFGPSPSGAVIWACDQSHLLFQNTIIAWDHAATTMEYDEICTVSLMCSDIYGNDGGDWVGGIAPQLGQDGNISLDPQFCSASPSEDLDWSIHSESPCAPAQSGCGLIGAGDVGCGPTPTESRTWGGVKLLFLR